MCASHPHHASAKTPSSHSAFDTHPTFLQTGHETITLPSPSSTTSAPRAFNATRSALIEHPEWKICARIVSPPPFVIIASFIGIAGRTARFPVLSSTWFFAFEESSSDGPNPQLTSNRLPHFFFPTHKQPTSSQSTRASNTTMHLLSALPTLALLLAARVSATPLSDNTDVLVSASDAPETSTPPAVKRLRNDASSPLTYATPCFIACRKDCSLA
ncbi:hypothetical protein B0H34DRAFT_796238 [Crassisporium funariophilum]|nr:hypothetical protein B0H34DRAFT_796238 [Crassisporium funariophilum]